MKIGFLNRGNAAWTAGSSYTRSMVEAMIDARPDDVELCLIGWRDAGMPAVKGVGTVRMDPDEPAVVEIGRVVAEHGIDALLPVTEVVPPDIACGVVGWIPDFQHRRLPDYFTAGQREERDHHFRYLVENCDAMMFSSDAARADFHEFYPEVATLAATVPFPSSFAYDEAATAEDPAWVAEKYALPAAYALVINQFWRHKNHRLVVEAVARARALNPDVFVVMAGMMADSRDPTNAHVSGVVQRIFREKLFTNVALLGEVPGADLPALLRGAVAAIQPSEFEGWNTTVEDAIAFGKPVACSDIPTHREQAPAAFRFGLDDAGALAGYLSALDWRSAGWSGASAEAGALAEERARGRAWGARAIDLCRRAAEHHRRNPGSRGKWQQSAWAEQRNLPLRVRSLERQVKTLEKDLGLSRADAGSLRDQIAKLREDLARARAEVGEATKKYWRERQKPLRVHVREAVFGRED